MEAEVGTYTILSEEKLKARLPILLNGAVSVPESKPPVFYTGTAGTETYRTSDGYSNRNTSPSLSNAGGVKQKF